MKNQTTTEQNIILKGLGYNYKQADILYALPSDEIKDNEYAFSLTALLNLLPKEICVKNKYYYFLNMSHKDLAYTSLDSFHKIRILKVVNIDMANPDPEYNPYIDCCVKMLKLLNNKKVTN